MVKNLPINAGDIRDVGLIPGSGRYPGREQGNSLQFSCLENLMDRGAWWATVTKSQTQLKRLSSSSKYEAKAATPNFFARSDAFELWC